MKAVITVIRDNAVSSSCIKSGYNFSVFISSEWKLRLIAIIIRLIHTD